MRLDQFESDDSRDRREMPWRRHAAPVNKPVEPDNPNNNGPINYDEWNKDAEQYPKKEVDEEVDGIPEPGDVIRTKKMQMDGKVESVGKSRAGYDEVMFRIEDGRLMKTPLSNVIVIQKLADCDLVMEVAEDRIDEISNEVLAKYKAAAGKDAGEADKRGDIARGNKRFSGIIKATKKQFDNDKKKNVKEDNESDNFTADDIKRLETIQDLNLMKAQAKALVGKSSKKKMKPEKVAYFNDAIDRITDARGLIKLMYDLLLAGEGYGVLGSRNSMGQNSYRRRFGEEATDEGSMSGINRSAPAQDVSYEHVLDEVKARWEKAQLDELSVGKLKAYKDAATSTDVARHAPLRKVAKHVHGAQVANRKIKSKTGDTVGMHRPDHGAFEDYEGPWKGDPVKFNKAPRSTTVGNENAPLSELVKDSINTHGVKWAFDYYVKKHGMPPRYFRILSGI